METHVISRIEKLEEADKELLSHLQMLSIQIERVAVATEVLSEAMARQYEQNAKVARMGERLGSLEQSMGLIKRISSAVVTVGIGLVMYFLFGKP